VQAASYAFRDWYNNTPEVQKEFQRNNVHVLLTIPAAENVLWSMKKVTTAADLKGMRIRTLLGPGDALVALGATAVTVPYTDAIDLLTRGGVDAISTTPFEQGVKDGLPEMVNYLSPAARMGIFATVITAINLDKWKAMPKDLQEIFTSSANNALKFYASVRLDIRRIQTLKRGTEEYGIRAKVKVAKNKVAPPFRIAEFDILFGRGISILGCLLDLAEETGVVIRKGAWYSYEGDNIGQGRDNTINWLEQNPEQKELIEQCTRQKLTEGSEVKANSMKPLAAAARAVVDVAIDEEVTVEEIEELAYEES
jgi:hypothetical protein